jgi:Tfp pilus assembly protein PilF
MSRRLRLLALALTLVPVVACGSSPQPHDAASQLRFGVQMAERGLWSEAWFRFDRARLMGGGSDPQVLNNLAVAAEALGRFDDALEYYRQALNLAPGNADLKNNYDRFVGFYESFRAQAEAGADPAAMEQVEPAADYGEGSPTDPGSGGIVNEPPPIPGDPLDSPLDDPEPPPGMDPPSPGVTHPGGAHHG